MQPSMVDYVHSWASLNSVHNASGAMLSANRDRREGVRDICNQKAMDFSLITLDAGTNDFELGYEIGRKFIVEGKLPPLVFPRDDSMAVGFYSACSRYGVRVPEDVSIMSFGKFYPDALTPKKLSTFDRRVDLIIDEAVKLSRSIIKMKDRSWIWCFEKIRPWRVSKGRDGIGPDQSLNY